MARAGKKKREERRGGRKTTKEMERRRERPLNSRLLRTLERERMTIMSLRERERFSLRRRWRFFRRRGHDSTGVTDRVVNQLLTQLDGAEEDG